MIKKKFKEVKIGNFKFKIYRLNGINNGEYLYEVELYIKVFPFVWVEYKMKSCERYSSGHKRFNTIEECLDFINDYTKKYHLND